ncbi:hypothetical protein RDV89_08455 [Nocardioides zeae]|uniref:Carbon monoxide dehydrogenase subunit G n=1 Tax=Nocardioides imazamoxiresistens TaxID=3231893 RepID=A0ABU3PV40_9ACTN|nr:SRPBCC family protein [Nocardioides zeae]MDT9593096.1 hypothetical protein [Nocardioides zeae]
MATFTTTKHSTARLPVPRERIWAVLSDPALLAELTPLLTSIEADGDLWHWRMAKVPGLAIAVRPEFTERMSFDEPARIDFVHEPQGDEDAGAEGWYVLTDVGTDDAPATDLEISLTIHVDLPLPRISAPAVQTAMKGVVASMGNGFAENLEKHLGI